MKLRTVFNIGLGVAAVLAAKLYFGGDGLESADKVVDLGNDGPGKVVLALGGGTVSKISAERFSALKNTVSVDEACQDLADRESALRAKYENLGGNPGVFDEDLEEGRNPFGTLCAIAASQGGVESSEYKERDAAYREYEVFSARKTNLDQAGRSIAGNLTYDVETRKKYAGKSDLCTNDLMDRDSRPSYLPK